MLPENLLQIYAQSFKENWDLPALSDYSSGNTMTYGDLARNIASIHCFFESLGIKRGDKIALMGKNSVDWVLVYMSTITYGATIVPVLQDFSAPDAQHIINHSDSKVLFVDDAIWSHGMEMDAMPKVKLVMSLTKSQQVLAEHGIKIDKVMEKMRTRFKKLYPNGFKAADIVYPDCPPDHIAEINYTSGTTGFSKGVMLTLNNLCGNVVFGIESQLLSNGNKILSFLPLAHAYGCAFDMLVPLAVGAHTTVLGRLPSPAVLLQGMAKIKPHLIISVPLILEKIYRKKLQPMLKKKTIRRLMAIPGVRNVIYKKIRTQLTEALGGRFEEMIIGGAPLNAEVEKFLHTIGFRFTVGYGMTECGPLISYTPWRKFIVGSSGRTLPRIMESKILSVDPENIPGEICVRGENVMLGYYKNPEATEAVLDADGWLHTGDMGTRSSDGTIFIKGRYKTMILSATGQNIYPEEIEAKINNMPYVAESLVVERGNSLVALVYPDFEATDKAGLKTEQLQIVMDKILEEVNKMVAPYERIHRIQLMANEFEKTPKKSIKRFLYS